MFMLNRFVSSCAASALIRLEGPLGGMILGAHCHRGVGQVFRVNRMQYMCTVSRTAF